MIGRTSGRRRGQIVTAVLGAIVAAQLYGGVAARAEEAGLVARVNGTPSVVRDGKTTPLRRGDTVHIGDRLETNATAKIKLLLADDSVLAIGPDTQIVLDELTLSGAGRKARLRVLAGRFKIAIAAWLSGPSDYTVHTPTAVAGVRGTILWGDTQLDAICALEGHVEVRAVSTGTVAEIDAGHCVTSMGRGETAPLVPSREDLAKYLRDVTLD